MRVRFDVPERDETAETGKTAEKTGKTAEKTAENTEKTPSLDAAAHARRLIRHTARRPRPMQADAASLKWEDWFGIHKVPGDGSCFFHALEGVLNGGTNGGETAPDVSGDAGAGQGAHGGADGGGGGGPEGGRVETHRELRAAACRNIIAASGASPMSSDLHLDAATLRAFAALYVADERNTRTNSMLQQKLGVYNTIVESMVREGRSRPELPAGAGFEVLDAASRVLHGGESRALRLTPRFRTVLCDIMRRPGVHAESRHLYWGDDVALLALTLLLNMRIIVLCRHGDGSVTVGHEGTMMVDGDEFEPDLFCALLLEREHYSWLSFRGDGPDDPRQGATLFRFGTIPDVLRRLAAAGSSGSMGFWWITLVDDRTLFHSDGSDDDSDGGEDDLYDGLTV